MKLPDLQQTEIRCIVSALELLAASQRRSINSATDTVVQDRYRELLNLTMSIHAKLDAVK